MSESRLTRSETDKMIAGVCGGLAEYLNLDPVWVRLLFVLQVSNKNGPICEGLLAEAAAAATAAAPHGQLRGDLAAARQPL